MIRIQHADFDLGQAYQSLQAESPGAGAIVLFVGLVRDFSDASTVQAIVLEHYPGMTEKVLHDIAAQARVRWPVEQVLIIHRIGELQASEQIVCVGVASSHRSAAFAAAEFIMDMLKTQAPLWKKERRADGEHWLTTKDSDMARAKRWQT